MIKTALKEWQSVAAALGSGRQMILLRKGGISESAGGFSLECSRFLLFPTHLHQRRELIKAGEQSLFRELAVEPETIDFAYLADVVEIVRIGDRRQIDAIEDEHIWMPPLIDMRFNYRPANPLYLLIVRTSRLPSPVTITNTLAYAGCVSWVDLDEAIDTRGALSVMDDAEFDRRARSIKARLNPPLPATAGPITKQA